MKAVVRNRPGGKRIKDPLSVFSLSSKLLSGLFRFSTAVVSPEHRSHASVHILRFPVSKRDACQDDAQAVLLEQEEDF